MEGTTSIDYEHKTNISTSHLLGTYFFMNIYAFRKDVTLKYALSNLEKDFAIIACIRKLFYGLIKSSTAESLLQYHSCTFVYFFASYTDVFLQMNFTNSFQKNVLKNLFDTFDIFHDKSEHFYGNDVGKTLARRWLDNKNCFTKFNLSMGIKKLETSTLAKRWQNTGCKLGYFLLEIRPPKPH